MGLKMIDAHRQQVPHRWVVADDEFGRVQAFRAGLRKRHEPYALDVPCSTAVRDVQGRRPPRRCGRAGPLRVVPFVRAEAWAAAQPADRWVKVHVKDGAKSAEMPRLASWKLCAYCHQTLAARPSSIKQVVFAKHLEEQGSEPGTEVAGKVCFLCHKPHSPLAGSD
mgnify:CR=1 FL=1